MGNCGFRRRRKSRVEDEESPDGKSGRISQNSYGDDYATGKEAKSSSKCLVKSKIPALPWRFDRIPPQLSIRHSAKVTMESKNFRSLFKKYMPTAPLKNSVIRLRQCPKVIPYVYAAALGFTRLEKAWKKCRLTRRPGIKSIRGGSGAPFCDKKRLNDRTFPPEKEKWWRYTMFLLVDPLEKDKFPKKLAENGGQLVSVESRTGCEIRIGEKKFLYRGNLVRHFFIDGPTQNAIVCCQKSLPQWLLKSIIIDHDNSYRKEPIAPEPVFMKLERFAEFGLPRQTALVK